jgi:hypothetical protein
VTVQHQHTKLLNAAAREVLRPLGVVQKGRSRTWLDDHGWWLGVIEFQPSSWSRGSYLNVGVNWLWDPKDYLSFDFGHRIDIPGEGQYIEYENEEQFSPLARKLAMVAAEQVRHYRDVFPTLEAAAATLRRTEPDDVLRSLDAGIALGLAGDGTAARSMFSRYVGWFKSDEESEWRTEVDEVRYHRARQLSDLARTGEGSPPDTGGRQKGASTAEARPRRRVAVLASAYHGFGRSLGDWGQRSRNSRTKLDGQARFKASASIMSWFAHCQVPPMAPRRA